MQVNILFFQSSPSLSRFFLLFLFPQGTLGKHSSLLRTFGFLRSLPTIHSSHQSLEQMHWFEATFKMFGRAVFEAIEVKGCLRLNLRAATSKFFR